MTFTSLHSYDFYFEKNNSFGIFDAISRIPIEGFQKYEWKKMIKEYSHWESSKYGDNCRFHFWKMFAVTNSEL